MNMFYCEICDKRIINKSRKKNILKLEAITL